MKKEPDPKSLYREARKNFSRLNFEIGLEKNNLLKQKKALRETGGYLIKTSQKTMIKFCLNNIIESLKRIIRLEEELEFHHREICDLDILVKLSGESHRKIKSP
ncbi:MAG: hypothetical protein V3574_00685 [Candidatus Moraniibacteriota bacterium]